MKRLDVSGAVRLIYGLLGVKRLRKRDVKRWRKKALNREEWACNVREAKAKLKGT
jgi:hypothetical protein